MVSASTPAAFTTDRVAIRRSPAVTATIRSPSRSIECTGAPRSTSTPLRAASSAYPMVRRIESMMPSSGKCSAARASSLISGSSARA